MLAAGDRPTAKTMHDKRGHRSEAHAGNAAIMLTELNPCRLRQATACWNGSAPSFTSSSIRGSRHVDAPSQVSPTRKS